MGQRSAETVREIEQTREALDSKLLALEERMPEAGTVKRIAGLAVGSGAGSTIAWFAVKRVRARRKAKKEAQRPINRVKAMVPDKVKAMPDMVGAMVPDRLTERITAMVREENAKQWLIGGAVIWMLMRIGEMRRQRALLNAIAAR